MRKKLTIRSERIRQLTDEQRARIKGGFWTEHDTDACGTGLCNPSFQQSRCASCGCFPQSDTLCDSEIYTCNNTCTV